MLRMRSKEANTSPLSIRSIACSTPPATLTWTGNSRWLVVYSAPGKSKQQKGEEVFDMHCAQFKWQPREERQKSLRSWLDTDCGCGKCRAEGSGPAAAKACWLDYIATCSQNGKAELDFMIKQSVLHVALFMPFEL